MDKLIEELVGKKEITLFAILSVFAPSFMLIFIWNRNLFLDLEFLKLFVLSICLGIVIYVPNLVLSLGICPKNEEWRFYLEDSEKDVTFDVMGIAAALLTCAEIAVLICYKIYHPETKIEDFLNIGIPIYITLIVLCGAVEIIYKLRQWIKTARAKLREWLKKLWS